MMADRKVSPDNVKSSEKLTLCYQARWVFPKIGVPQNGWFIMENPIKMDDLGVPLFLETPRCWMEWMEWVSHAWIFFVPNSSRLTKWPFLFNTLHDFHVENCGKWAQGFGLLTRELLRWWMSWQISEHLLDLLLLVSTRVKRPFAAAMWIGGRKGRLGRLKKSVGNVLKNLKHAEVLGPHLTYHSLPKPVSFAQNSINHKSPSSSSSNRGIRLSTIEGLQGGSPGNVAELNVFFHDKNCATCGSQGSSCVFW